MGFASSWLEKRALFPQFISEEPDQNTGIITVVPAYNEPGITCLLDSLSSCEEPLCKVEVLIIINAPPEAPEDHIRNNKLSISLIEDWCMTNNPFFRVYAIETSALEGWGVGMARKSGMDEALRRFNCIDNAHGVILCLDADCTVKDNYFISVESELHCIKKRLACSICFEHEISGDSDSQDILMYELHLRYYLQGLIFAGYPYPFHTVGSSMAVKALQYLKVGGMNRRQAGEDFYFIQKLVGAGDYFTLISTTVFPSSRKSYRVPFGTGAAMEKLSKNSGSQLHTYNFNAFRELKTLFDKTSDLYNTIDLASVYKDLPTGVRSFISEDGFLSKLTEIRNNTSTYESFRKRFFEWFNMFRIIKFMNHVHEGYLQKMPVSEAAMILLKGIGEKSEIRSSLELLHFFRMLERN